MMNVLETVQSCFSTKPVELGEFASFRVSPMNIRVKRWELEGLGGLTLMEAKAPLGLMRMETLVITPDERDLVLFSWDLIEAMGQCTLILDYYDFPIGTCQPDYAEQMAIRDSLLHLTDCTNEDYPWMNDYRKQELFVSRKGKKKDLPELRQAMERSLHAYLKSAETACPLTEVEQSQKREQTEAYVRKLFELGSPTTKVFAKAMSEEKARAFYQNVMFCP